MSINQDRDPEQQDSDDGSFDGDWESKSEASTPSSQADNEQPQQECQSPASDRLDPELVDYLIQNKTELTLDTIKSFQRVATKLKQSNPERTLDEHLDYLEEAKCAAVKELDQSRKEVEKAKCKSKLLQDQLKKELNTFDKLKVDNILKNSGGNELVESMKRCIGIKDATIKGQNGEIDKLELDISSLQERLSRANKHIDELRKALQQAQTQPKSSNSFELDRRRNLSNQGSVILAMSPEQSFGSGHVPPPPLTSVDDDELLQFANSPPMPHLTSGNSSTYDSSSFLNNSVPPPPEVYIDFDQMMRDVNTSNGGTSQQGHTSH